jgi:hypothetical protein
MNISQILTAWCPPFLYFLSMIGVTGFYLCLVMRKSYIGSGLSPAGIVCTHSGVSGESTPARTTLSHSSKAALPSTWPDSHSCS